jgi:hypothetical protein
MLAYYVEWRMREAWRSVLFADVGFDPSPPRPVTHDMSAWSAW